MNSDQINKIFRLKTNISSTNYLVNVLSKDKLVLKFEDYLAYSNLNANHNSFRSWNRFIQNIDHYLGFLVIPEELTECESRFRIRFDSRVIFLKELLDGTCRVSTYGRTLFNTKSVLPVLQSLFNLNEIDSIDLWDQIKYNNSLTPKFIQEINKRFNTNHTESTLRNCIIGLLSY